MRLVDKSVLAPRPPAGTRGRPPVVREALRQGLATLKKYPGMVLEFATVATPELGYSKVSYLNSVMRKHGYRGVATARTQRDGTCKVYLMRATAKAKA